MSKKISIVVCSTNILQAHRVCLNVLKTSGLECEFFIHDNNFFRWSLAKTYNSYILQAQSRYILLCHQDVEFVGNDWGLKIIELLDDLSTGVISFAGSTIKLKDCYSGWLYSNLFSRRNYCCNNISNKFYYSRKLPFDEVVTVDGLAMFVRKDVALKYPFDEKILTGFHCYDLDFSMTLHRNGYKNYVFTDKDYTIIHTSPGRYNRSWAELTKIITDLKWNEFLPLQIEDVDLLTADKLRSNANLLFDSITNGESKENVTRCAAKCNRYQVEFNKCDNYLSWI